ncbi:MAG: SpoIIIAH-like family protein [Eubacterium sp.]|nr:SpoIIIAH-like family protein [Eubacterium sp.]MBR7060863.1 SpoIIIAH-like family protein [Eubacterium sp.]
MNNETETKSRKMKKEKPILTEQEIKKKKARKTKLAAASFVFILSVGILGNWYYQNSDLTSNISPMIESSETKTLGEAEFVAGVAEEDNSGDYFNSARINRQKTRDESLEVLQKVVDSSEENSEAKNSAAQSIAKISDNIAAENKIETLVCAKNIDNCLAVISNEGDKVDVIVDCKELSKTIIMQIKDIAMKESGCSFENISVIQTNQ